MDFNDIVLVFCPIDRYWYHGNLWILPYTQQGYKLCSFCFLPLVCSVLHLLEFFLLFLLKDLICSKRYAFCSFITQSPKLSKFIFSWIAQKLFAILEFATANNIFRCLGRDQFTQRWHISLSRIPFDLSLCLFCWWWTNLVASSFFLQIHFSKRKFM